MTDYCGVAEDGPGSPFDRIMGQKRPKSSASERLGERFAQATIDALTAHICVVDERGRILAVNEAWRSFGQETPPVTRKCFLGENYLSVCERSSGPGSEEAVPFATGLRGVIEGRLAEFGLEYPCHAPKDFRWFAARVTRFRGAGPARVVVAHENITERRQAEEALRESEARLRAATASSNTGLWDWDLRTNEVYYSPSWKRQIGYEEDEISNRFEEWESRVHPEDLGRAMARVRAFQAKPWPDYENEFRFRHKDGSYRWVIARASVLLDEGGKPCRMLGSHLDITERKRVEEALRASEERYRSVVEDQTEVICRFRADGTITFVNEVYCRLFGKRPAELLGGKWQPKALAEDLPVIEKEVRALSPANAVVVVENRVHAGDGQVRWMQFVNRGFFDSEGELTEIQAVGRDITKRKQAEESLRASEARYRSLVESSLDAVLLTTREGGILAANEAACNMLGRTEAELIRVGRSGVVCPADPRLAAGLKERLKTGRFRGELTLMRRDGTKFPAEVSSGIFTEHRGEVRTSTVIRDITERRRAQEELSCSRETMRALAARVEGVREEERARIAREMHDELGHAMTDLKLDLAWLARRLAEGGLSGRSSIRKRIAAMSERAEAGAEAVRRIATELRPAVLDGLGLAAAIEWQAREFQRRTHITCGVETAGELPPLKAGQSTAMFRIFQEILTNVARHARASRVRVRLAEEGGRLVLRAGDNGRGITEAERCSATALGLLGMRERAAALGGELAIASRPGRGSEITVSIPVGAK